MTDSAIDRGKLSSSGFNLLFPGKKALVAIENSALENIVLLPLLGMNPHYFFLCPYHEENITWALKCVIPLCVYELISGYVVSNTTVYV